MGLLGGKKKTQKAATQFSANSYYRPTVSTRDVAIGRDKGKADGVVHGGDVTSKSSKRLSDKSVKTSPAKSRFMFGRTRSKTKEKALPTIENTSVNQAFTRSRTLTAHRPEMSESDRLREHNLRAWRRKLGGLLAILLVLVAGAAWLLMQFNGNISTIVSNAPHLSTTDSQRYEQLVTGYFAKNPLERFGFALHQNALSDYVSAAAPEMKSVKISGVSIIGARLELTFREPVAQWTTGAAVQFVDASGAVFSKNYFAAPEITITDSSSASADGGAVASSRFLTFVGQVSAALAKSDLRVEKVDIPAGAIRYVNVFLQGKTYPFMAHIDRDPAEQAADIVVMAKYLDANHIMPHYVDVRVAGKAFWK
jgi:hypothetical protein